MTSALHTPSELHAGDATVKVRCDDGLVCRLEVHTDDGTAAAHVAALLVRQAVLDSLRTGVRTVALTLDPSSPACGAVLSQLHDLASTGAGTLRLRRAGETVLVDLDLRSTPPESSALPTARRPAAEDRSPARGTPGCGHADPAPRPSRTTVDAGHRSPGPAATPRRARGAIRGLRCGARPTGGWLRAAGQHRRSGRRVPAEVDGLPVDVCVTGPLTALPDGS